MHLPGMYRLPDVLPSGRLDHRSRNWALAGPTPARSLAGGLSHASDPRTVSRQMGVADNARRTWRRISTATHQGEMRQRLGDLVTAHAWRDRGGARQQR